MTCDHSKIHGAVGEPVSVSIESLSEIGRKSLFLHDDRLKVMRHDNHNRIVAEQSEKDNKGAPNPRMMLRDKIKHIVHIKHAKNKKIDDIHNDANQPFFGVPIGHQNGEHIEYEIDSGDEDGKMTAFEGIR